MIKSFILMTLTSILLNSCSFCYEKDSYLDSIKNTALNFKKENIRVDIIGDFKYKLLIFNPENLSIRITNKRPEFNSETFLCIPAAYTSRDNKIDGFYILKGIILNSNINKELTGGCVFYNNKIKIFNFDEMNNELINNVIKDKTNLLQQTLLIHKKKVVKCSLFGETKNTRRALFQNKNNSMGICESILPLTINEFQQVLLKNGITNAINLDMGSWSEGWIKNERKEKIILGENISNTYRQTNWLIFTKNKQ